MMGTWKYEDLPRVVFPPDEQDKVYDRFFVGFDEDVFRHPALPHYIFECDNGMPIMVYHTEDRNVVWFGINAIETDKGVEYSIGFAYNALTNEMDGEFGDGNEDIRADFLENDAWDWVIIDNLVQLALINAERIEKEPQHRPIKKKKRPRGSYSQVHIATTINGLCSITYKTAKKRTGIGHKPGHEFDVRGHWRHYKSGKKVWIESYTKCKGRGAKIHHTYKLTEGEE